MGYSSAAGYAECVAEGLINLEAALHAHLTSNHFPPLPADLVAVAKEAIAHHTEDDKVLDLPEHLSFRGHTSLTVAEAIASMHLEAFLGLLDEEPAEAGKETPPFVVGDGTPAQVVDVLIAAHQGEYRVRLWYGDPNGRAWEEEHDVTGYISFSTGTLPCPILVNNRRSLGGPAISTARIVKVVRTADHAVLYQHPQFAQAFYHVGVPLVGDDCPPEQRAQYVAGVYADGGIYANCRSVQEAIRLSDFMNGRRMNK